jgi:hypothetical protein
MDVKQAENEAAAASYCSEVVDQIFGNSDLAYLILAACDAATMFQLGAVNRAMHSILQSYMQTAFSINHLLSRFFPDPDMFRIIQRKTATLICGTQVLQFFDRSDSVDSDLELLLFPGREREIAQFLEESGYEFAPRRNQMLSFAEEDARAYHDDLRPLSYPNDWIRESVFRLSLEDSIFGGDLGHSEGGITSEDEDEDEEQGVQSGVHRSYFFVKEGSQGQRLRVQLLVTSSSPFETILTTSASCKYFRIIKEFWIKNSLPRDSPYVEHHFFRQSILSLPDDNICCKNIVASTRV